MSFSPRASSISLAPVKCDYSLQAIAADLNNDGKIDIITASDFGLPLGVLTLSLVHPCTQSFTLWMENATFYDK